MQYCRLFVYASAIVLTFKYPCTWGSNISSCYLVNMDMSYDGNYVVNLTKIDKEIRNSPAVSLKTFVTITWANSAIFCAPLNISYQYVFRDLETQNGSVKLSAVFMYRADHRTVKHDNIVECIKSATKIFSDFKKLNFESGLPKLQCFNGTKVVASSVEFPENQRYCCEDEGSACCPKESSLDEFANCVCNPGYHRNELSNTTCSPCPVGTFQDVPGMAKCLPCPNGTTSTTVAATTCITVNPDLECPSDYSWDVKGIFSWETTKAGSFRKHPCPYGPPDIFAKRGCVMVPGSNPVWGYLDTSSCTASARSESLFRLSQLAVTRSNVNDIAMRLLKETEQVDCETEQVDCETEQVNSYDLYLASIILDAIVSIEGVEVSTQVVNVLDNIMNVERQILLESQKYNLTTTRILKVIDKFGETLPVSNGSRFLNGTNIEIRVRSLSTEVPQSGVLLTFVTRNTADHEELRCYMNYSSKATGRALRQDSKRLVGKMYKNSRLFPVVGKSEKVHGDSNQKSGTKVVGAVVLAGNFKDAVIHDISDAIELHFVPKFKGRHPLCVHWDFEENGGFGNWSSDGCYLAETTTSDNYVTCRCNHLTNFAMLLTADPESYESNESHRIVLGVISYVGCAISLAAAVLTLITYEIFQHLRRGQAQLILCHLCVALIGLLTSFLVVTSRTPLTVSCRVVGVVIHYFLLATFAWMAAEGVNMYLAFVKVMSAHVSRFMSKAVLASWGIPGIIVIITASLRFDTYSSKNSCFLHGLPFYISVLIPAAIVVVGNIIMFILTMYSLSQIGKKVSQSNQVQGYQRIKVAVSIMVLLGLTWVFGLLAIGSARLVFQYAFCIFNSLQGLAIFGFHCVRQAEVRECWIEFLCRSGSRKRRYTGSSTLPALKAGSNTASPNLSTRTQPELRVPQDFDMRKNAV